MKGSAGQAAEVETASPAVCRAGYFQFSGGQRFSNECIQSRGLYWCKSGRGHFRLNGVDHELLPQDLYVLPWNRSIAHFPDSRDPMHTGHVHIVPHYRRGSRWIPNVPHEGGEAEFDSPDRRDIAWPGFEQPRRFRMKANEPLGLLIDYAIRWYILTGGECEEEARSLADLLVRELFRKNAGSMDANPSYPGELERMILHVEKGYPLGPTVTDLAKLIGRSRSHVLKLFRQYTGVSPKSFIIIHQLREARELLLSTTLPVAEVGKAVGLPDPYHFSKLFHRHVGVSPTEYRKKHGPVSILFKPGREHQPFTRQS